MSRGHRVLAVSALTVVALCVLLVLAQVGVGKIVEFLTAFFLLAAAVSGYVILWLPPRAPYDSDPATALQRERIRGLELVERQSRAHEARLACEVLAVELEKQKIALARERLAYEREAFTSRSPGASLDTRSSDPARRVNGG